MPILLELANTTFKGSASKHFWLFRLYGLRDNYSTLTILWQNLAFAANRPECNMSSSGFHQTLTNCWKNEVDSHIRPQTSIRMSFVEMGWEGIPSTFNSICLWSYLHKLRYLSLVVVVWFLDVIIACFLLFVVVSSVSRKKDKNFYVEQMLRVRRREIVNQLEISSRAGIWPHPESQILHLEIIPLQIRVTWGALQNPLCPGYTPGQLNQTPWGARIKHQ